MRILFVSYRCPPVVSSEALLIPRTLWALEQLGCEITILTVQEASCSGFIDSKLMELIPPSVEIIRVPSFENYLMLCRNLPYRVLTKFGLSYYCDLWYFPAVKKGKSLLANRSFDLIYSRASTWISNVVGLSLKRESGLPWIAHFSDPWVDNPYWHYNVMQRRWSIALEKSIMREADSIVFTNPHTVDYVMKKYPEKWKKKAHSIPHGYDPRVSVKVKKGFRKNKRLKIMHAGKFFGQRSPIPLFKALEILNQQEKLSEKLEIVFIGHIDEKYRMAVKKKGLSQIVTFCGELTYHQTSKYLEQADVLMVIEAAGDIPAIFLPSKIIDYLPFYKTIFGLVPLNGPSANLLQKAKCPVAMPDDINGITLKLSELLNMNDEKKIEISSEFEKIVLDYDIRNLTKRLIKIMNNCSLKR